jgi:surface antigen
MTSRNVGLAVVGLCGAITLGGCSAGQNTAVGTGVGALGGAAIGGAVGGWRGALIGAAVGGVAGAAVGLALDDQERRRQNAAMMQAAEENRAVAWAEPGKASGTITPRRTYVAANQRTCREFDNSTQKDGRTETSAVTLCRNADGTWSPA